jgi:hypothetical protein
MVIEGAGGGPGVAAATPAASTVTEIKSAKLTERNFLLGAKSAGSITKLGTKLSDDLIKQAKSLIGLNNMVSDTDHYNAGSTEDFYVQEPGLYQGTSAFFSSAGDITPGIIKATTRDIENPNAISLALGRCPVMNPPWQFGELDDVRSNLTYPFIGRVYLNEIFSNYPIVVFEPGIEKFNNNVFNFWGLSLKGKEINDYVRGDSNPIKKALTWGKNLILAPIELVSTVIKELSGVSKSKFVYFQPRMKVYKHYFNEFCRDVAVKMGLIDISKEGKSNKAEIKDGTITNMNDPDSGDDEQLQGSGIFDMSDGLDSVLKGVANDKGVDGESVQSAIQDDDDANYSSPYIGSIKHLNFINMLPANTAGLLKGMVDRGYIPFLVQHGVGVSESFTNDTEPHPVASKLNSSAEEAQQQAQGGLVNQLAGISTGDFNLSDHVAKYFGGIAKDQIKFTGEMGLLLSGSGRTAFPEIWSNSRYSRSYSLNLKLFSPVGDTVSIFENVYIQFLIILCLTLPIQIGKSNYMSPFCVRVYSKGLFSVDFGMIDSLSVTRGEEVNDRSIANYPRTMNLSISIKDLNPVLSMSLGNGPFFSLKRANTSLTEYIATISNLSIADRYSIMKKFDNWFKRIALFFSDDVFNMTNIGFDLSQSFVMKPFMWFSKSFGGGTSVDQSKFTKTVY